MAENKNKPDDTPASESPEGAALVRQTLDFFANHFKRIGDNLRDFNQRKKEVEESIDRGARRTDGRIV